MAMHGGSIRCKGLPHGRPLLLWDMEAFLEAVTEKRSRRR